MADIVASAVRSRMMSGIRGKNTGPELTLRKLLHSKGLRFRLHQHLPGKPDLVLPRWNAAVFVHGCFWHRHECATFKWPTTRDDFWREKLSRNADRDARNVAALVDAGWRVAIVWECALRADPGRSAQRCEDWLRGERRLLVVD